MLSKADILEEIEKLVESCGLELFDVLLPSGDKGSVRVFVQKLNGQNLSSAREQITHEDCVVVSKKLLEVDSLNWLFEKYGLEVSSAGINRALSKTKHFETAVGERIRFTFVSPEGGSEVIFGKLKSCDEAEILVHVDGIEEEKSFPREAVKKARVDFDFSDTNVPYFD